jgi:hypothetical protein
MEEALRLKPDLLRLAVDCCKTFLDAGLPERWLKLTAELPESVRTEGRMVVMEGHAALKAGHLDRVERILASPPIVDDMKEGEVSLTELWFGLHEQRLSLAEKKPVDDELKARVRRDFPPPHEIDFRMTM